MAYSFHRTRSGVRARMASEELTLMRQVFADLLVMLEDRNAGVEVPKWARDLGLVGLAGSTDEFRPAPSDDPALARLLPSARPDDEEAATEFRRLTEPGLRQRKRAALGECVRLFTHWLAEPTGEQLLTDAQALNLLTALTDVRLLLAQRLGVNTDEDAEHLHDLLASIGDDEDLDGLDDTEQERLWAARVYEFLTWLQESLVGVLAQAQPFEGDGTRTPPPPLD